MKKLIALSLVLTLTLTLCACSKKTEETNQPSSAESGQSSVQPGGPPPEGAQLGKTTGVISMLNMSEDDYSAFVEARRQLGGEMIKAGFVEEQEGGPGAPPEGAPPEGAPGGPPTEGASGDGQPPEGAPEGPPPEGEPGKPPVQDVDIVYYDTLDSMLMGINAGDIDSIEIYQSVARYLCATNDNLSIGLVYDLGKELTPFAEVFLKGVNGNDFAFLMLDKNTALRDEFNTAIDDMKADGTLDRLVKEQIDDLINGGEIKPVEIPKFDGAETVKVAVTGALPPMDYVAADGTPAGFNTAVLAEIGKRTGKNIELVVVDSVGRSTALASGTVDAVFWTRTNNLAAEIATLTAAEIESKKAEVEASLSEEDIKLLDQMKDSADLITYGTSDTPAGTITTESYYSDVFVPVQLKR